MARKDAPVMEAEPEAPPKHSTHEHTQHQEQTTEKTLETKDTPSTEDVGVSPLAILPPLGKTPTDISQILVGNLGDKATRFTGPVVSGGHPGSTFVRGAALCSVQLQVDRSMGASFSLPMQFPRDCQLLWAVTLVYTAFTGGTGDSTFKLGTTSGAADILAATNMGAAHANVIVPITGTIPYGNDANPGKIWFSVSNGTNTAGIGMVTLIYSRCHLKYS